MRVLADTPVWSGALRRGERASKERSELEWLIQHGAVAMIGVIRQELLSGIKAREQFETVRAALRKFPDEPLETADYELAAEFLNRCRARGIQGSPTDYLICAVASRRDFEIFTTDGAFGHYGRELPITLYQPDT